MLTAFLNVTFLEFNIDWFENILYVCCKYFVSDPTLLFLELFFRNISLECQNKKTLKFSQTFKNLFDDKKLNVRIVLWIQFYLGVGVFVVAKLLRALIRPFFKCQSETLNFHPLTLNQIANVFLHRTSWFFFSFKK